MHRCYMVHFRRGAGPLASTGSVTGRVLVIIQNGIPQEKVAAADCKLDGKGTMQVDRYLFFFSVAITFTLRVTVAWLLCFLVSQLLRKPNHRFLLWLSFGLGSAGYWCATLASVIWLPRNVAPTHHPIPFTHFIVPAEMEQPLAAAAWFLIGAYLVGMISLVVLRVCNRVRLRRLLQFGGKPMPEFADALQKLCGEVGVKRCELVILPGMASPATVYWWTPRIMLPEICHRKDRIEQFVHIMRHELVHIRRRDFLVASIMDFVCAVLCFHPALWSAKRRMRTEREFACDLRVVAARPEDRADYAASLAQFLRWRLMSNNSSSAIQFAAPAALLGRRVRTILLDPVATPVWRRASSVACGVLMVVAFAFFAPELSVTLNVAPASQQLASAEVLASQTFRHHLRSSLIVPVAANPATQTGSGSK